MKVLWADHALLASPFVKVSFKVAAASSGVSAVSAICSILSDNFMFPNFFRFCALRVLILLFAFPFAKGCFPFPLSIPLGADAALELLALFLPFVKVFFTAFMALGAIVLL